MWSNKTVTWSLAFSSFHDETSVDSWGISAMNDKILSAHSINFDLRCFSSANLLTSLAAVAYAL